MEVSIFRKNRPMIVIILKNQDASKNSMKKTEKKITQPQIAHCDCNDLPSNVCQHFKTIIFKENIILSTSNQSFLVLISTLRSSSKFESADSIAYKSAQF